MEDQRFGIKSIFDDLLCNHCAEELEAHWAAGTLGNIPTIEAVDTRCPKPWGFLRIVSLGILTYLILLYGWSKFHNVYLLPGLIVVGSAVLPIGVLFLFFELNIRRNVSMFLVEKMLLLGGAVSLIISLFMFILTDKLGLGFLGSSVAGIAEETGKLLAVIVIIRRARYPYILNGLLFGVAVGAGFTFLETAGYALDALVENVLLMTLKNYENLAKFQAENQCSISALLSVAFSKFASMDESMLHVLNLRGLLSPFGHVIWTAIAGGALWNVKGGKTWKWRMLLDRQFLLPMLAVMLLHGIWNCSWELNVFTSFDKQIVLGILGWCLALHLVRKGLAQVACEKQLALQNAPAESRAEAAMQPVIQIQYVYQDSLTKSVESPHPSARPPRKDDHLNMDEQMADVDRRERERQAPDFTGRPWMRHYQEKTLEGTSTGTPAAPASPAQQEGTPAAPVSAAKSSWRKYYDQKE